MKTQRLKAEKIKMENKKYKTFKYSFDYNDHLVLLQCKQTKIKNASCCLRLKENLPKVDEIYVS